MNQAKRFRASLAFLLAFLLCFSGTFAFAENRITYTDVAEDYWAAPYIYEMTNREIVGGYGDGTFGPLNQVERGEYAKMLTNIADLPLQAGTGTPYADVDTSQWYFPYVKATQAYINGFNENGYLLFKPEDPATREDVTVALMKALGDDLSEYYYIDNLLSNVFWDYESIAVHNRPYVAAAVDRGFITGHQDGSFKGGDGIQRDEMCAILHRAFPDTSAPAPTEKPTATPAPNALPTFAPTKSGELQVFYLDVGQGDSEFVELPTGETLLIDAGTAQSGKTI